MRLNVVPLPQTRHPLKGRLPARDEDDVDDVGDIDDVGDVGEVDDVDVFSETDFSDADTETFLSRLI